MTKRNGITRPENVLAYINKFSHLHRRNPAPKEISHAMKVGLKVVYDSLDVLEAWRCITVERGPGGYRRWGTMRVIREL